MRKYQYIFIFIIFASGLPAQDVVHQEEHNLTTVLHPWLQVNNAAGLGLTNIKSHGLTALGYFTEGGDYHRAQEGNLRNGLNFYSERYDKLGKNWNSWGSFNFLSDREKNRAWSDVFSTYNSNPFIFGSSIPGSYDRQLFDFHIKLSSKEKNKLSYGFGVDYLVGDLSRLRDPRTRIFLADYAFLPGLVYRINSKHVLGINLKAAYRKEKLPNITTVQDDPNLKYYTFFGMENADANIGGFKGFQRQFVGNTYGGELQYSFKAAKAELLLTGGIHYEKQQILENLKQSPGNYEAMHYKFLATGNYITDNKLFQLTLSGNMKTGAADEFLQKLESINDTVTKVNSQQWITLYTYDNRYINSCYNTKLTLNIRDINAAQNDYSWLIGLETGISGFTNQYHLPFSEFSVNRFNTALAGHYRLINRKNNRLILHAEIEYSTGFDNLLQLSEGATDVPTLGSSTFKQGIYDLATNIYIPDLDFFNASTLKSTLSTQYSFPLNLKKTKIIGFAKLSYHLLNTNTSKNWSGGAISIGIIP